MPTPYPKEFRRDVVAVAAVRRWPFGPRDAGQVVYLVLDDQREVHLLLVQWLGR